MLALAVAVLFGVVAGMLAAFYLAYLMKRVKGGKDLDLGALTGLLVFLVGGNGVAGPVTTYALAQPELWLWYGVSSFGTFILLSIFSVIQYIFR